MVQLIAGVDIGNSTTEVCLAEVDGTEITYIASGHVPTTGVKGTPDNTKGVVTGLRATLDSAERSLEDLDEVRINEAAPVISDLAMETITETVITESTMIGHNPSTPGGVGLGVGETMALDDLDNAESGREVICVVPGGFDFAKVAKAINAAVERGVDVKGAVVRGDDGVLINNRLDQHIPIVDEVGLIEKVPLEMQAAVEVAEQGATIRTLSNSYGLATVFELSAEETKLVAPVARALMGNRSAVVIRTPEGDVQERVVPAGAIAVHGEHGKVEVEVDAGAEEIMKAVQRGGTLDDVQGEPGTNVGGMLSRVREVMADETGQSVEELAIRDVLAVDTFVPQDVQGGLAGEFSLENAVALAAMVRTSSGPIERIAEELTQELDTQVVVGGVEANMAVRGGLTTPGTDIPIAVLDLGGGSTDAALDSGKGAVAVHLAGAGDMVTKLIGSELGVDTDIAEQIKKRPLAKVESLFHVRLEDGSVRFFDEPLPSDVFARVVILKGAHPDEDEEEAEEMVPVPTRHSLDKIRAARRDAKHSVFVVNALRALRAVAPNQMLRQIEFVVLLGGSALDFEIPDLISEALGKHGIVCGRGNVRGSEGPRNAVATGLVSAFADQQE